MSGSYSGPRLICGRSLLYTSLVSDLPVKRGHNMHNLGFKFYSGAIYNSNSLFDFH